jgi:hypothetical protein
MLCAGMLLLAACSAAPTVRAVRTGVQTDPAGRPFVEVRTLRAIGCRETAPEGAEAAARAQLTRSAQAQGYSGVIDVVCANGTVACVSGTTCSAIAVRYVVPDAAGRVPEAVVGGACNPPCAGNALCQDGQCVTPCEPPCTGNQVCVQDGTCQPVT